MLKRYALLGAAVLALAVFVPVASADPLNAKNSLAFPATCGGQTVQVVVDGNGRFTPAHVVGSTAVFVPQAFNITFEFTPTGGTTESVTDTSTKPTSTVTSSPAASTSPNPSRTARCTSSGRRPGSSRPRPSQPSAGLNGSSVRPAPVRQGRSCFSTATTPEAERANRRIVSPPAPIAQATDNYRQQKRGSR